MGDLHEAMLQSMTEDRSFDDVLPAYKTFANNVMLLQGTRLVHYNWDRFKLQVHDLETLDAFIAPLLGVLFCWLNFFDLRSFELCFLVREVMRKSSDAY